MLPWLVITADRSDAGRGVRGHALVWFLRTYFGRRRVGCVTPEELRRKPRTAETVLLGLPSSLPPEEINSLIAATHCRRLVLFDYLDQQELAWSPEQEPVLRGLTDRYLKPWFEPACNYGLRMGLLPIRRYGRFTLAVTLDHWLGKIRSPPVKEYDVAFLGRPNYTRLWVDGKVRLIDQRFQWIRDLKRNAPDLRFWGGLVEVDPQQRAALESQHGDISDLLHTESKVNFATYYGAMRKSRVLLAPGGNVPWTYRHYECLYAGGVVVTIDYRQRDMLIPLPREGMVHVPDGASVAPYVREALELSRERPSLPAENIAHLERYLRHSAYSSSRPTLIDRFTAQLI